MAVTISCADADEEEEDAEAELKSEACFKFLSLRETAAVRAAPLPLPS